MSGGDSSGAVGGAERVAGETPAVQAQTTGAGTPGAQTPSQAEELVPMARVREVEAVNERLRAQLAELERKATESEAAVKAASEAAAAAQAAVVAERRRALLAEHAGKVVPELVQGETVEALEASVKTAAEVFQRIAGEAAAARRAQLVPAGVPARDLRTVDVEQLSSLDKIARGLAERAG